jgi:hypothetical protein
MKSNDKHVENRKPYTAPIIIPLGLTDKAHGECVSGSNPGGGNADCTTGQAATQSCSSGTVPRRGISPMRKSK